MANIPTTQNNPGDLKTGGQIATYSDPVAGKAALYNDLTAKMTGTSSTGLNGKSSLLDFSKVYAPASDGNDPIQYAANLSNQLGVSPDTQIGTLLPRIDDFAKAVSNNEGYQSSSQSGSNTNQTTPTPTDTSGVPDFVNKIKNLPNNNVTQPSTTPFNQASQDVSKGNYLGAAENGANGLYQGAKGLLNDVTSHFAGLAAIPTQAIASRLGEPDPFSTGFGVKGTPEVPISPLTRSAKGKDLGNAGLTTAITGATAGVGSGISGLLESTPAKFLANASPAVKSAIAKYIPEVVDGQSLNDTVAGGAKTFGQMYDAVENEIKATKSSSTKRVLQTALAKLLPLADKEDGNVTSLAQKGLGFAGNAVKSLAKRALQEIPYGTALLGAYEAGKHL